MSGETNPHQKEGAKASPAPSSSDDNPKGTGDSSSAGRKGRHRRSSSVYSLPEATGGSSTGNPSGTPSDNNATPASGGHQRSASDPGSTTPALTRRDPGRTTPEAPEVMAIPTKTALNTTSVAAKKSTPKTLFGL